MDPWTRIEDLFPIEQIWDIPAIAMLGFLPEGSSFLVNFSGPKGPKGGYIALWDKDDPKKKSQKSSAYSKESDPLQLVFQLVFKCICCY